MRVHELAKELGLTSKDLVAVLGEIGVPGLSASSTVPDGAISRLRASGGKATPGGKVKEAPVEETRPARPRATTSKP
ncbi:MAG: translation initiation factor IF-2 N-terminal domain-containing protein, partial [Actinomycetota bacterium]